MTNKLDNLYELLSDDEDARACKAIPDEACKEVPQNYVLILLSSILTKASDTLSSTKLVIPWLLASMGVPAFFSGLLVPIRESGSMLPQLAIGAWVRQKPIRKYFYVWSSVVQSMALFALAFVVWCNASHFFSGAISGATAGWLVLACVTLYSLSRGFTSVASASKDILGKTIPKQKRGVLSGQGASFAGGFSICIGLAFLFFYDIDTTVMMVLLIGSAILMMLSGLLYIAVEEHKGANDGGKNGLNEAINSLSIIKTDKAFRSFVITRALMMSSALATPYIVMLAQQTQVNTTQVNIDGGTNWFGLGSFIAIAGLASLVSSVFWGKQADKDSRAVMTWTAFATAVICFATVLVAWLLKDASEFIQASLYALSFFLLAITHQGVRLGRKVYVVDLAEGNQRTTYVTVSNTLIGILLLLVGLISALLSEVSITFALVFFGITSVIAGVYSRKMVEV